MLGSLEIKGFRGLRDCSLQGLARLNLLAGPNQAGKTAALECVELLRMDAASAMLSMGGRRGALGRADETGRRSMNALSLFTDGGRGASVAAKDASGASCGAVSLSVDAGEDLARAPWALVCEGHQDGRCAFAMAENGELSLPRRALLRAGADAGVRSIGPAGLPAADIAWLLDRIALTEREEMVREALRLIEPQMERWAVVGDPCAAAESNILLKGGSRAGRVPLTEAGAGLRRMLGLSAALANAENGILIVDGLEAELHPDLMKPLWRLLQRWSARLSVQVFATTQSRDCCAALAQVAEEEGLSESDAVLQMLADGRSEAVHVHRGRGPIRWFAG